MSTFESFISAYLQQDVIQQQDRKTSSLDRVIKEIEPENKEVIAKKEDVLKRISFILALWAKTILYSMEIRKKVADQKHIKLFTFGSYSFGDVYSPDTDIDVLCVTSSYVSRHNFFNGLSKLFEGMKEVSELLVVPGAHIPIIKMKFSGVSVDLVFAQVNASIVYSKLDLCDDDIYKLMDDKSFPSIGGYRITQKIIELVPNFENFCGTLRAVKIWAKRRNLYSNMSGFLGGAAWAILTAAVCQMFPDAAVGLLVSRFFEIYSMWNWSVPVKLDGTSDMVEESFGEAMQIITPVNPPRNSSHNVSQSTLYILKEEFIRARNIILRIDQDGLAWRYLYEEEKSFFKRYQHYTHILVTAKDEETHRRWQGWIRSRLPLFIAMLEQHHNLMIAHPCLRTFQFSDNGEVNTSMFIGLATVYPCTVPVALAMKFISQVCSWKEYDQETMGIQASCIRYHQLPDFVHEPASGTACC